MTILRYATAFLVLTLLLSGCEKTCEKETNPSASTVTYKLSMNLAGTQSYLPTSDEKRVETLDLYLFVKSPADGVFRFEKEIRTLPFSTENDVLTSKFDFDGTLQRKLYFIANESNRTPLLSSLTPNLTSTQFENQVLLEDSKPESPFVMVSRYEMNNPEVTNIAANLSISAVRLDIANKYNDFVIESMILKNAVGGTFLFNSNIPTTEQASWSDKTYGPVETMYLYPTNNTKLAVYGKFRGVSIAFDVPIPPLVAATRYKLTINSNNNDNSFEEDIVFEIVPWTPGNTIESTPDWKNN